MNGLNIPEYNADVNMDIDNNLLQINAFPDWFDALMERNMLDAALRAVSKNCLDAHGYQCDSRVDCPAFPKHCMGWRHR